MTAPQLLTERRSLTAATALGIIGALTIMIAPGFVGLIGEQARLDDAQVGYVIACDINAMAAAIAMATFLIARVNWRVLALLGLGLIAIGSLATSHAYAEGTLIAARICTAAGEGLAVGVSFAALGQARDPDRAFGAYLAAGLTISATILLLLPIFRPRIGTEAIFIGWAVLAIVITVLVPGLPPRGAAKPNSSTGAPGIQWRLAISGLLGVFLYFIAQGAVWSYLGRIGAASGLDASVIGRALGLSSLAGIGGALLAVLLSTRFGRALPLAASAGVSIASFLLLRGHVFGLTLIAAGMLFNAAWNFSVPYFSGLCADADARGRVVCSMGCIQTVGTGLGPAIAATLLSRGDFSRILWLSTAIVVVSVLIVILGLRTNQRETASRLLRLAGSRSLGARTGNRF